MKVALMKEGFGHPTSDRTTNEKVRGAIAEFQRVGRYRRRGLRADALRRAAQTLPSRV
jgi:hypothetical protein